MDPEAAALLNERFVCVKLDREERPDIDALYMDACTAISGQGGWPLTAFLNPDKSPFYAGTYYTKSQLTALLAHVSELWETDRGQLAEAGSQILSALSRPLPQSAAPRHGLIQTALDDLRQSFDPVWGGFRPAPKFPSLQRILFLLRHGQLEPDSAAAQMAETTLQRMQAGGIFDQVGGGFFRYATDEQWRIPHYEKMLYDNAIALLTYAEAAAVFQNAAFADTARRCRIFLSREMKCESGGYYTALDAESPEGEGAFYLWTSAELIDVLGEAEGRQTADYFDVESAPVLPRQAGAPGAQLQPGTLDQLYVRRAARPAPMRDEKLLTSGNALTTAALAVAGRLLGEAAWIQEAEQTADFLLERLCADGRLKSAWFDGRAGQKAVLDDYAYFVWALLELYQATFRPKWLGLALTWNAHMLELFGGAGGGLFLSGRDVTDLPARQKAYADGPLPSGNATAAMNLFRLHAITGDDSLQNAAEGILKAASGILSAHPAACCGLLSSILLQGNVGTLTISDGTGADALIQAAGGYRPFLQVIRCVADKPETVRRLAPSSESAIPVDGRAAAYLCDRRGCHRPVTEPDKLRAMLG